MQAALPLAQNAKRFEHVHTCNALNGVSVNRSIFPYADVAWMHLIVGPMDA